jgi:hypothetical protein
VVRAVAKKSATVIIVFCDIINLPPGLADAILSPLRALLLIRAECGLMAHSGAGFGQSWRFALTENHLSFLGVGTWSEGQWAAL